MSRGAEGNWRSQISFQCVRELYFETSWWAPRFADWKKPIQQYVMVSRDPLLFQIDSSRKMQNLI